jgi:hypothetical protein
MAHRVVVSVPITLDGAPVESDTRLTTAGPDVLILSTCVPSRGVDVHSVYMGNGIVETQAHHWALGPSHADAWTETHDAELLPVRHARSRCLYDHLHALQDWLRRLGYDVGLIASDDAIAALNL